MRRLASFLQTLVEFLLHFTIAIPGSLVAKLLMTYLLMATGIWHTWGGNDVWYSWTVWICGLVLGIAANTLMGQRIACFAWLAGAIWIVCWITLAVAGSHGSADLTAVIQNMFPTGPCRNTIGGFCLFFAIVTIPAMNSFSYSIGATLGLALNRFWPREKVAAA